MEKSPVKQREGRDVYRFAPFPGTGTRSPSAPLSHLFIRPSKVRAGVTISVSTGVPG